MHRFNQYGYSIKSSHCDALGRSDGRGDRGAESADVATLSEEAARRAISLDYGYADWDPRRSVTSRPLIDERLARGDG